MFYNPQTNQYIRSGEGFTHDGNQYPAGWDKQSLGFVEVTTVGTRENDAYFWISEELADGVRTITNTPKDPEMIAAMEAAQAAQAAQVYLASTDWYVTRQVETGVAVPTAILEARAAARLVIPSATGL